MAGGTVVNTILWISVVSCQGAVSLNCHSCHYVSQVEPPILQAVISQSRGDSSCLQEVASSSSVACGSSSANLQHYCISSKGNYTFKASIIFDSEPVELDVSAGVTWRGCVALDPVDVTNVGCHAFSDSQQEATIMDAAVKTLIPQGGDAVTIKNIQPMGAYCVCAEDGCNAPLPNVTASSHPATPSSAVTQPAQGSGVGNQGTKVKDSGARPAGIISTALSITVGLIHIARFYS